MIRSADRAASKLGVDGEPGRTTVSQDGVRRTRARRPA
jgi:hypothetical protein